VFQRTCLGHLHQRATYVDKVQGLSRVVAQQSDFGVEAHVLLFTEAAHRIDQHVRPVIIAPYDRCLQLAIGHDSSQSSNARTVDEVKVSLGNLALHRQLLFHYRQGPEEVSLGMFRKVALLIGNNILQGGIIVLEILSALKFVLVIFRCVSYSVCGWAGAHTGNTIPTKQTQAPRVSIVIHLT